MEKLIENIFAWQWENHEADWMKRYFMSLAMAYSDVKNVMQKNIVHDVEISGAISIFTTKAACRTMRQNHIIEEFGSSTQYDKYCRNVVSQNCNWASVWLVCDCESTLRNMFWP